MRFSLPKLTASLLAAAVIGVVAATPANATSALDCFSEDMDLRIRGCTSLLEGNLGSGERARALSSRALGYSMKGWYAEAITDYDLSLSLLPDEPTALNNRAWAYYRWGKPALGENDVERSLRLDPTSGAAFDTRAHIAQALGRPTPALADYKRAMNFGGSRMIKMYQCGLTDHGLYQGPVDGIRNADVEKALAVCVQDPSCDPLPANEECRLGTS